MKKTLYILFPVLLISLSVSAQDDSLAVTRAWRLDADFRNYYEVDVDTNLTDFHVYFPNYKESVSNTFLGNIGSPTISNIFTDRTYADDVFFLNQYLPYFYTAENSRYYNTRKPFSYLSYSEQIDLRERTIGAFITENINPELNFALQFGYIASKGQYRYQHLKNYAFRTTVNYTRPRYMLFGTANINKHNQNEGGGINDDVFENQDYTFLNDIPSRISGPGEDDCYARNDIYYYDLMVNQRLKLFTLAGKTDTTSPEKKRNIAEPVLNYTIRAQRTAKNYAHQYPYASGIYDVNYFNAKKTLDSLANFRLTNQLNLEFKTTFKGKVQLGLFGSLTNEYDRYYQFSKWDTTYVPTDTLVSPVTLENGDTLKGIDLTEHFGNTSFSAGLYGEFWNKVRLDFSGRIYFLGYKAGQTDLKGRLATEINLFRREFLVEVNARLQNKVPAYLLRNYYSNHFMWQEEEQNLNTEVWTSLSGKISAPSNKFELTGDYYLISGLIYFNSDVRPVNHDNAVNVLSISAAKTFRLWKIYSKNKIVYQLSEDPDILAIPNLVLFSSTYFNHNFQFKSTGGELEVMLGVEFFYTTRHFGYEYSPALSQFYSQDSELIGNYPLLDAFLNIKLKRARFFLKLQHFNSPWGSQNYYAAIHYPHYQLMNNDQLIFKFGISWAFFD